MLLSYVPLSAPASATYRVHRAVSHRLIAQARVERQRMLRAATVRLVSGLFFRAVHAINALQARLATRHHLRELDDRMLRDVGLTRADVTRELSKPFWRD